MVIHASLTLVERAYHGHATSGASPGLDLDIMSGHLGIFETVAYAWLDAIYFQRRMTRGMRKGLIMYPLVVLNGYIRLMYMSNG